MMKPIPKAPFYLPITVYSTNGISHPAYMSSRTASPHFGRYTFADPQMVEGWVGLGGWLHACPKTVTHHSTNRPIVGRPGIELMCMR